MNTTAISPPITPPATPLALRAMSLTGHYAITPPGCHYAFAEELNMMMLSLSICRAAIAERWLRY
jgi:hypothetical protein